MEMPDTLLDGSEILDALGLPHISALLNSDDRSIAKAQDAKTNREFFNFLQRNVNLDFFFK